MSEVQVIQENSILAQSTQATSVVGEALARAAAAQIQTRAIMAHQKPRDVMLAYQNAMKEIEIHKLATSAVYSYSRGGQVVSGPTIEVMVMIARHWRNLDYDWAEIQRCDGYSICQAWCIDLEANNGHKRTFTVPHTIDLKSGNSKKLTADRDIRENNANIATRNMRACMEKMIPTHIIEDVIDKAKRVAAEGDSKQPWEVRLRNMLIAFGDLGVTKEMLEKRLKHEWKLVNQAEFVEYFQIHQALLKGDASREDFFPEFISEDATTVKDLNAKGAAETADLKRKDLIERVLKLIETKRNAGMDEVAIQDRIKMSTDMETMKSLKLPQLQAVFEILSK